jgi:hypothetical protein
MRISTVLTIALAAALPLNMPVRGQSPATPKADKGTVEKYLASWKQKPKEVANTMIEKYGLPQEATAQRFIWHGNGRWKFTELVNEEIPHDFPMAHHDMLYQAIDYRVADSNKVKALFEYDGSVILERTKGELAARCDKEEANFLAINLANDVATGKRSVEDARRFYAESIQEMMKTGKPNEYLQGLRFTAPRRAAADPDRVFGPVATSGRER